MSDYEVIKQSTWNNCRASAMMAKLFVPNKRICHKATYPFVCSLCFVKEDNDACYTNRLVCFLNYLIMIVKAKMVQ